MSNTNGIIALIFGIVGCCFGGFLPFGLGFLFPFVAIIFGAIGIKKDDSNGMAIAGLILGIISLICVALVFFLLGALLMAMFGFIPMI